MTKRNKIGLITVLAFAVIVMGSVSIKADYSFIDRLADKAGEVLGLKLASEVDTGDLNLGASASPDKYNHQRFLSNYSVGGGSYYATSSTASAYTLTTDEFPADRRYNYVEWTANVNTTLTTMASSSAPLSDLKIGETYTVDIYAASTTAASTITFSAGTGVDMQEDEGETVVLNGLEIAELKFQKKSDTDVLMWVRVGQVGD